VSGYPQGFYVRDRSGTIHPALTIPGEHVIGSKWRVLIADFGYKDKRGRWHWALRGMPYDGESSCFRDSNRIGPATIHDHYCYMAEELSPGEARNALREIADALYKEMLECIECWKTTSVGFWAAVRAWSFKSRWAKAQPSYITDLAGAYRKRGIEDCLTIFAADVPAESARRG